MANQFRPDMYRAYITLPVEQMAKVRTVIRGKRVTIDVMGRTGPRRAERIMMPSDYLTQLVIDALRDVQPDAESLAWMADQSKRLTALRKKADEDVASGKFRKPKSEWKKPGRVAGKKYPKIDAAMKKLGAERREMTAKGIKWRGKNG